MFKATLVMPAHCTTLVHLRLHHHVTTATLHTAIRLISSVCAEDAWFDELTISANDASYLPSNSTTSSAILSGLTASTSTYQPAFNCSVTLCRPCSCLTQPSLLLRFEGLLAWHLSIASTLQCGQVIRNCLSQASQRRHTV